jgi:hypothetical protein
MDAGLRGLYDGFDPAVRDRHLEHIARVNLLD